MTITLCRYDDLPDPAHDPEAAEALAEDAADANPDADLSEAIAAAENCATTGRRDAQAALAEARAYGLATNHAAYGGPLSAARYAASACERAARRARDGWQRASEAADDAGSIAHADPAAAEAALLAAQAATVAARLARRAAYEARLEAEKATEAQAAARRSDQRPPAPTIEALAGDLINALGQARAAFSYLAVSHPIATDRPAFGRRAASAALLLNALVEAAPGAEPPTQEEAEAAAERFAEEPDHEAHACPACTDRTLTGAAGPAGLCPECEKAEAEKGQG